MLPNEAAAEMSGVILRKKLDKTVWDGVDAAVKAQLQAGLVQIVRTEGSMKIRSATVEVIQRICELILESGQPFQWEDMYQTAIAMAQAESPQSKTVGLKLFSNTCFYKNEEAAFIQGWMQLINAAMHTSHGGNLDVRIAASDAAKSLIVWVYDGKSDKFQLSHLVAAVIQFAVDCCRPENLRTNDEAIKCTLQDLEELTANAPVLFRPHLTALLQMVQVVMSTCDDEGTKITASEVAITLCEMKPNMIKKHAQFAAQLLAMFSDHIVKGTEEDTVQSLQTWNAALSTEDDDEDEMVSTAKQMLDRLSCCLEGEHLLPVIFHPQFVPAYICDAADWKKRYTALFVISQMIEGVSDVLKKQSHTQHLQFVVAQVLARFADPHPRVRWAAINAIGQMLTDMSPVLHRNYHEQIVGSLLQIMEDVANPRVRSHAAACVVNFCDKECILEEHVVKYAPQILASLYKMLSDPQSTRRVVEEAITGIAAMADAVPKAEFVKYYETVFTTLCQILQRSLAAHDGKSLLVPKTVECMSHVAGAVEMDTFSPHSAGTCQLFIQCQATVRGPNDPLQSYLVAAWSKVAAVMGKDFAPYLPNVMQQLLGILQLPADAEAAENEDPSGQFEQFTSGDKTFNVNSGVNEDKVLACQTLLEFLTDSDASLMLPYADHAMAESSKFVDYKFCSSLREGAPSVIGAALQLLSKSKASVPDVIKPRCLPMMTAIMSQLKSEWSKDCIASQASAIGECVESLGEGGLTPEEANAVMQCLAAAYKEAIDDIKQSHVSKQESKDEDEDVKEDVCADDIDAELENAADGLTNAIGALAKVTRPFFKQMFDPVVTGMVGTFQVEADGELHVRLSLCLLDEVIESMGAYCAPYLPTFVPLLLQFCSNPSPALRQAAIYGLGVSALSGAAEFKPFAAHVLTSAQQLVSQPNSRDDENCYCTDNAVAAVIKCLAKHSDAVDVQGSLALAISYLPFTHDVDEMVTAMGYIVDLMNANLDFVVGAGAVNLPKIIKSMAIVLWHTTYETESEERKKVIAVCKTMAQRPDLLAQMHAALGKLFDAALYVCTSSLSRVQVKPTLTQTRVRPSRMRFQNNEHAPVEVRSVVFFFLLFIQRVCFRFRLSSAFLHEFSCKPWSPPVSCFSLFRVSSSRGDAWRRQVPDSIYLAFSPFGILHSCPKSLL